MAIYRKIADLPYRRRPSIGQTARAKQVKAIAPEDERIVKRSGNREFVYLGSYSAQDIPAVLKGYRKNHKEPVQVIIENEDKTIVGISHIVSARGTMPEQVALKMVEKYRLKGDGLFRVVLKIFKTQAKKPKPPVKKSTKKKSVKSKQPAKTSKKAAKKPSKKPAVTKANKRSVIKKKVEPKESPLQRLKKKKEAIAKKG